jgi:L-alanine-DL-glutamate epimerase-like enolase superfamily enzyme
MEITDIRTLVVGNPWKNRVFVIVEADNGIRGIGESTGGLSTAPQAAKDHPYSPSNFLMLFQSGWERRTVAQEARPES